MVTGNNVSHLVAKVMHHGVDGGPAMMRPVVWSVNGKMTFELVHAERGVETLGVVERVYTDVKELLREISDAHVKWGYPTVRMLEEAFPNGQVVPPT